MRVDAAPTADDHRFGIRTRTTIAALVAVAVVLSTLGFLILREARNLDRGFTAFETAEAAILLHAELDAGNDPATLMAEAPPGTVVLVDTPDGVTFQWGEPGAIDGVTLQPYRERTARLIRVEGRSLMLYDSPCMLTGTDSCRMRIAVPETPLGEFLTEMWWEIARIVIPVLVFTALAVPFLVGRSLRIIGRLTNNADDIAEPGSLHQLPVPRADDELRRLTLTLNDMLTRLHQAHEAQRRFIADASHELRSPVTAMSIITEMASRFPERRADPATWQRLTGEVDRLKRVVAQLLDHASNEGRRPDQLEPVDLVAITRAQLPTQATTRVEFAAPEPAFALATVAHVETIAANLIANATRHAHHRIQVEVRRTNSGHVELSVTDDGNGIAPADHERVFEPFTRLDVGRAQGDGGTGLGLTIARAAARACRGDIEIDPTRHSTFICELPNASDAGGLEEISTDPGARAEAR